jgi:hypothetical protein
MNAPDEIASQVEGDARLDEDAPAALDPLLGFLKMPKAQTRPFILTPELEATGYRECERCGHPTIRRAVCLRCEPEQPIVLPPPPCERCTRPPLEPFTICQSCRADDLVREMNAARRRREQEEQAHEPLAAS